MNAFETGGKEVEEGFELDTAHWDVGFDHDLFKSVKLYETRVLGVVKFDTLLKRNAVSLNVASDNFQNFLTILYSVLFRCSFDLGLGDLMLRHVW